MSHHSFIDTCSVLTSTKCVPCNCNSKGSVSTVCKQNGDCICKDDYYGAKCNNRDCEMTNWSAWNNTCPCGHTDPKTRTRSVLHEAQGNGIACPATQETTNCTMVSCNCARDFPGYYGNRCENRDCEWSSWSSWSTCKQCSAVVCLDINYICPNFVPQKARNRTKERKMEGNGAPCLGGEEETNSCGYTCTAVCKPKTMQPSELICPYRQV